MSAAPGVAPDPGQAQQPAPAAGKRARGALGVPGLMLAGYGFLVLTGVLAHEAAWTGWCCLLGGTALAAFGASGLARSTPTRDSAPLPADASSGPAGKGRRLLVLGLGLACMALVLAYNVLVRSSLSAPEWAILLYGLLLVAASGALPRRLGPLRVGDAVGWSFALVLAPLALYALNAFLSRGAAETAAAPSVSAIVVAPTAAALRILGTPVTLSGTAMTLATPRGSLILGVGLVCAGLYPMVLFGGLVGLHAWRDRVPARRVAALLGLGLAGLWALNIVRLAALARIGIAYGPGALEEAHANLGWILFAAYMLVFWWAANRRWRPIRPILPGSE